MGLALHPVLGRRWAPGAAALPEETPVSPKIILQPKHVAASPLQPERPRVVVAGSTWICVDLFKKKKEGKKTQQNFCTTTRAIRDLVSNSCTCFPSHPTILETICPLKGDLEVAVPRLIP